MTECAAASGPGEHRVMTQSRVESTQGRGTRAATDEMRRHEHLGQHPDQLTFAASRLHRPRWHYLPGSPERYQPCAKLHQVPKHRIHTTDRSTPRRPSAIVPSRSLWTALVLWTTPARAPACVSQGDRWQLSSAEGGVSNCSAANDQGKDSARHVTAAEGRHSDGEKGRGDRRQHHQGQRLRVDRGYGRHMGVRREVERGLGQLQHRTELPE